MPSTDKKIIRKLMESDPESWPSSLQGPSAADPKRRAGDPERRSLDPGIDAAIRRRIARAEQGRFGLPSIRGRRPLYWSGAAAALLLLAVGFFAYRTGGPGAVPPLEVLAVQGAQIPDESATNPAGPLVIELPAGAFAYLRLGSGGLRLIGPGSYRLERSPGAARIVIERGDLLFASGIAVGAGDAGNAGARSGQEIVLVLETPRGRYEKTGTTARLRVNAQRDRLEVLEGAFVYYGAGERREVVAGKGLAVAATPGPLAALDGATKTGLERARELLRKRAGEPGGAPDLTELESLYGEIYRVRLHSGETLEGHLFTRDNRMFLLTPAGERALNDLPVARIQALAP